VSIADFLRKIIEDSTITSISKDIPLSGTIRACVWI